MTDYQRECRVTFGGQDEPREANAEMGGLCHERCEESRRRGRLEEEDKRQMRVEKTIRRMSSKWGAKLQCSTVFKKISTI